MDNSIRTSDGAPLFTVFTATYNRAHTLHRVFDSLRAQTLRDFEWLVIDDGSTDKTAELMAQWTKLADFPVRYFKQANSGKHIAHNVAIREARGLLFAPLDSDDAMPPDGLQKLARAWNSIPVAERPVFCGVWGLCRDQHGALVGDQYPASPFDADLHEVVYVRRIRGEKWCALRTDVLRQFPFPEIRKTQFVPEGMIWLQMARRYKTRYVNDVVRIYYVDDSETGATLCRRTSLAENAPGRLCYSAWLLDNELDYFLRAPMPFVKAAVTVPILARFSGQSFSQVLRSLKTLPAKLLVCLGLPFAAVLAAFDKARAVGRAQTSMHRPGRG